MDEVIGGTWHNAQSVDLHVRGRIRSAAACQAGCCRSSVRRTELSAGAAGKRTPSRIGGQAARKLRRSSSPAPDHQSGADSVAGRTAECLRLSSRFCRTGPAASPHASDTVITCEKPPAQWMGIDRQGTFSALAPTTHNGMSVGDCQQCCMQPGHPESRAGAQTATSVDPMRWAPSVLRN